MAFESFEQIVQVCQEKSVSFAEAVSHKIAASGRGSFFTLFFSQIPLCRVPRSCRGRNGGHHIVYSR